MALLMDIIVKRISSSLLLSIFSYIIDHCNSEEATSLLMLRSPVALNFLNSSTNVGKFRSHFPTDYLTIFVIRIPVLYYCNMSDVK